MTFACRVQGSCRFIEAKIILILAALLFLSGCWVSSVNGLEENGLFQPGDKDVTFDQMLLGEWHVTSDNCTLTLTVSGKKDTYDLSTAEEGGGCNESGKKVESYQARLLKLDDHLFLDISPRPDDVCGMCLPLHCIFLTKLEEDTLSLIPIDDEWLKGALEQRIVTLATMPGDTDRLTAPSKDLKAFCRKYADNKEAFKPVPSLMFKRSGRGRLNHG